MPKQELQMRTSGMKDGFSCEGPFVEMHRRLSTADNAPNAQQLPQTPVKGIYTEIAPGAVPAIARN